MKVMKLKKKRISAEFKKAECKKNEHAGSRRGAALLSTMIAMAILTILGTSIIYVSGSNFLQSTAYKNYEEAYYDSEQMLRLGSEAIKKAGVIEIGKILNSGGTSIGETFTQDVIPTALLLLPSDILSPAAGEPGLGISLSETDAGMIELVAVGQAGAQKRSSRMSMTLAVAYGTAIAQGEQIYLYSGYSMLVGGDIWFQNVIAANSTFTATPLGALAGTVIPDISYLYNISDTIPEGFVWWDSVQDELFARFEGREEGFTQVADDKIEILATGANYPLSTVNIVQSDSSIKIGDLSFQDLNNKTLLVQGDVNFDKNLIYNLGKLSNFMVFATGNICIDLSLGENNLRDNLFTYAGGDIYFYGSGGVKESHYLTVYANNFYYTNNNLGAKKPDFYGQFLVKGTLSFEVTNASLKVNMYYNEQSTLGYYERMKILADYAVVEDGGEDSVPGAPFGNLFNVGKIIEIQTP